MRRFFDASLCFPNNISAILMLFLSVKAARRLPDLFSTRSCDAENDRHSTRTRFTIARATPHLAQCTHSARYSYYTRSSPFSMPALAGRCFDMYVQICAKVMYMFLCSLEVITFLFACYRYHTQTVLLLSTVSPDICIPFILNRKLFMPYPLN